jgi:Na+-driven multidrug efflux pump
MPVVGLVVLTLLVRGRGGALRVGFSVPRLDWRRVRRILNIGLPAGAEQILLQFALTSLTVVIARFGSDAYAAHQVAWRIAQLSFLPGWGFSVAATTLVGQELGAKQPQRAKESGYVALSLRQMAKHPRVAYSYRLAFGPCFCPFCP